LNPKTNLETSRENSPLIASNSGISCEEEVAEYSKVTTAAEITSRIEAFIGPNFLSLNRSRNRTSYETLIIEGDALYRKKKSFHDHFDDSVVTGFGQQTQQACSFNNQTDLKYSIICMPLARSPKHHHRRF
jgi:hypothetical protein